MLANTVHFSKKIVNQIYLSIPLQQQLSANLYGLSLTVHICSYSLQLDLLQSFKTFNYKIYLNSNKVFHVPFLLCPIISN